MHKKIFLPQLGFSLIEAMLAFLVVGFGLIGLAKLQSDIFKNNGENRVRTAAFYFAEQKLEQFRTFATQNEYESVMTQSASAADSCDPMTKDSLCGGINAALDRTWSVADCPGALSCRLVTVSVAWTDADDSNQKIILSSYIAGFEPVQSGVVIAR